MHKEGGVGGVQSCAEEECRLFPCVGRTGEPGWLQPGAVSPNEKSCVGHEVSPRRGRPEAKHSQKSNHSAAPSWPHMLLTHMVGPSRDESTLLPLKPSATAQICSEEKPGIHTVNQC